MTTPTPRPTADDTAEWGYVTEPGTVNPDRGSAAFTSGTQHVLDWMTTQRLRPTHGDFWQHPPQLTVHFGFDSGWIWGHLTISGTSGRLRHLRVYWIGADGQRRAETADGPTAIRAELERHAAHRQERITRLAQQHGLTVTAGHASS